MLVKRIRTRFIDLDLNFSKHPNTNDISKLVDARAIGRSIRNLVFTGKYESPFHPEISCGVRELLFEPMTPSNISTIQKTIEYCIINFEPRVELINVNMNPDYATKVVMVTVVYQIVGLDEVYQISFNLERTI